VDFDSIIDRRGTDSLKYDRLAAAGFPPDTIPMWVADMDFRTPACVMEALTARAQHGIFGYSEPGAVYIKTLKDWFGRRFHWIFPDDALVTTPGIVFAIAVAIRALTNPGDAVLVQVPVYHCFLETVEDTGRELVTNALENRDGRYEINFDDFERQIRERNVKLFILCSPHNPVGRIWSRAELERMGEICLRNDVIVISDEIHADFVLGEEKQIVFSSLSPDFARNTVLCTAPSKTFNIAGLQVSNLFIENPDIRAAFQKELARVGYSQLNVMGLVACQAAYAGGEPWLEALLDYLRGNVDLVRRRLAGTRVKMTEPEATYLLWLDFSAIGLSDQELDDFLAQKARVWLSSGPVFGPGGEGFQRMNIACPRAVISEALDRLEQALKQM